MKKFLLPLLLLISSNMFSQEKFELQIGMFSNQLVNPNSTFEKNGINTSFSINYIQKLSILSDIKIGLKYRKINHSNIDYFQVVFPCDISNFEIDYSNSWSDNKYVFHYLGIPIELKRKFTSKPNHFYFKFGIEYLMNLNSSGNSTIHECSTNVLPRNSFSKKTNGILIFTTGLGYEFQLKNMRTKFSIEPEFGITANEIQLNRITGINANNFRSMLIGIKLGASL